MVGVMEAKTCPICEAKNPPNALVCIQCGSTFTSGQTRQVPVASVPDGAGRIDQLTSQYSDSFVFFVMGDDRPLIVPRTSEPITFGRFVPGDEKPTVDLMDYGAGMQGVSRIHAMIQESRGGYMLRDLGSTNGTWLNETALPARTPFPVHNGDKIRLGQLVLHIYFTDVQSSEQTFFLVHRGQNHGHPLTGDELVKHVAPFLHAVEDLQQHINAIRDEDHLKMEINAITATNQSQAISVRVVNAGDAIRLLKEVIMPWKQAHVEAIQNHAEELPEMQKKMVLDLVSHLDDDPENRSRVVERLMPLIELLVANPLEIATEQSRLQPT